jgi:glycosyltransferase involved in cell wall biosynthesis
VVATLHDAIPLAHPEWANPKHRALKNRVMRTAARWADCIITVSQAMVPIIVEHFRIPLERISVVHNGVDDVWFEPVPSELRAKVRSRHGVAPGFFLTVGTLQPRKNIGRLLEAYRALPNSVRKQHPLVIVGRASWGVNDLIPTLRAAEAAGDVRWLDYVSDEELRALFHSAHAFVFPSLYEGFGLPVLEAFASGIPVVTSNVSSLPEVAGDAALLVDPLDIDALRDGMLRVTEDIALRARLVAAGSLRATQFTWRACAQQVLAVYRTVA